MRGKVKLNIIILFVINLIYNYIKNIILNFKVVVKFSLLICLFPEGFSHIVDLKHLILEYGANGW